MDAAIWTSRCLQRSRRSERECHPGQGPRVRPAPGGAAPFGTWRSKRRRFGRLANLARSRVGESIPIYVHPDLKEKIQAGDLIEARIFFEGDERGGVFFSRVEHVHRQGYKAGSAPRTGPARQQGTRALEPRTPTETEAGRQPQAARHREAHRPAVKDLALRTDLSGRPSSREFLARVCETARAAYAHQARSKPSKRTCAPSARQGLSSRVLFLLQNAPTGAASSPA